MLETGGVTALTLLLQTERNFCCQALGLWMPEFVALINIAILQMVFLASKIN